MHKENTWLQPATQRMSGVNKMPGSPRAWINRALDQMGPEISTGIIRSRDLTVSGIWHRPKSIPDLPYNALYRFFDYVDTTLNQRHRVMHKSIGAAWTVPADDIFKVLKDITATADLVWWAWPVAAPVKPEPGPHALRPHHELYALFDAGKTVAQVTHETGMLRPTVSYVHKKWLAGKPIDNKRLDHTAICDMLRTPGMTMQNIADQVGCSRYTVLKIGKANDIVRG
jgi:hypothetical protein